MWQLSLLARTGYFKSLSDALEVKARTSSVNDKITYAAEVNWYSRGIERTHTYDYPRCNRCYESY